MRAKDFELILDSLQMTAIYVIREQNHEILYYNRRVKEVAPNIELGMICHEVWEGTCTNCPLLHIGDKKEARSISYDDPFGEAIEIAASRILWEDEIPAFIITVTPYAEVANYAYHRVVRGNLSRDGFNIVKADTIEERDMGKYKSGLSDWLERVVSKGYIYEEDVDRYRKFVQADRIRESFRNGAKILSCIYRRRIGDRFRWHMLEIVPDFDYTDDNQTVMIYVKDVHELFREGLEREEINSRNQEIINILGEMNLGVYVVNLRSGMVNIVRTTGEVIRDMNTGMFLWTDFIGKMCGSYIDADYQEEFQAKYSIDALRSAWENGESKRTFVYRGTVYGERRYMSASAYFKENKKQGGYVILAFQDVDEQTKKDLERSQHDRRMAAIIKSRYSIMNTVDLETGRCERIFFGANNEDKRYEGDYDFYIRRALEEYVVKEDEEKFCAAFLLENLRKKAKNVRDYYEEICQYRYAGAPVIWVEEHILYIRQGKKTIVNILGRDITEEKLAEEHSLRDSLEKTSIINSLSSMFFAIYYIDLEKDRFRAVTQKKEVGHVLEKEKCYSRGIALYAQKFVHPDDREEYLVNVDYQRVISNLSRENPLIAFEYRMVPDQDNKRAWIRATIVLAESFADGRPRRALYVAQDVTESKEKEEWEQQVLKEACEAANYANASKSEFLSRMSHDIRTPMNAIIGMTAIAGRYIDDRERVADCLGKITVSSRHLLSLINEVLDMSKIESGKIVLAEEKISLSDLIDSLVTMIRPSVQAKKLNLNLRIVNLEHEDVIGDSMRLQQIFINILGNAVKYTPSGGNIELEIREKSSTAYGYGCYEFVFRDDGIGMSKEFQEKIFEPFSRAEDSRVSKIEGTGLGLTIARNIARMMNGNITVKSETGKGTEFVVTLFLKCLNTTAPDTEKFADLPVLVVDDDESASEMTCLILENIGMKGEYVLNGKEAVERVWERHQLHEDYFAVILDWKMPEMDGIETARAIRGKVGPDVPIIILSAYDWSGVEEEARLAGVNGFISKPLFRSRLVYLFHQISGEDEAEDVLDTKLSAGNIAPGKRVLLAEDNEINREIAEVIIGQSGVEVESVENGQEALDRFQEKGEGYYDLIFMDIQMPVMNGYDATAAIRRLPRKDAAAVPIIAMTANAFAEDVIHSKQAGMNEHLTKPLNVEQLMKCMERWLGEKAKK